jgi:dienelactone hydrolase
MRSGKVTPVRLLILFAIVLTLRPGLGDEPEMFADVEPIAWSDDDLFGRMMEGAHQFVERKIADAKATRSRHWNYDFSSRERYEKSVSGNRKRLQEIIGVVDRRSPAHMERFEDDENPSLVSETESYTIHQVRWDCVEGVPVEGLLAAPKAQAIGLVVVVPDADQTPEQLTGLDAGFPPELQIGRRLVENGLAVVIPAIVDRHKFDTDDERLIRSDQTHREWIYRQAYHMGRHVIGYEVQAVLAAIDWGRQHYPELPVGVAGYGEGGLSCFYAAAIDTRIDVALITGYFDDRQAMWSEPIYRNVWSLVAHFGDAEIASLILPRRLTIEFSDFPQVSGHKGDIQTPEFERVANEFNRIPTHSILPPAAFVHGENAPIGPWSPEAIRQFAKGFGVDSDLPLRGEPPQDRRKSFDAKARQARLVGSQQQHVQNLILASEHARDRFFLLKTLPALEQLPTSTKKNLPTRSAEEFISNAKPFRKVFLEQFIGQFDEPMLPPRPRMRKVLETEAWTAWDVVLDVYPELFAYGVLIVPNDLKPGERRPVVVCQHGRNGTPRDTIDGDSTAYNQFAARLAERGFITFAPQNLYRGEDRYRWLDRKAKSIGCTLFSLIVAQHAQILNWLESLPPVDGERIGFYGLSFGGKTAMQVPTVLEKYRLSICSGYFNDLTRKVAAVDMPQCFLRTIEWELPCWNLGNHFSHAEMAYLMVPRPFMVERGHLDGVARDRWVAHEYARVRYLYAQLGLADKTEIEYFQGGHTINGEGTFAFLHRHLDWPVPTQPAEKLGPNDNPPP